MTNQELVALIKKNPISVGCGLLSLAIVVGIYFTSDDVPTAEAELAKKSEEGGRLTANLQNAAQLKEQVDAMTAAEKELDARIVHAAQQLTNHQYFYKLESETGVKMTDPAQGPVPVVKGGTKTTYVGVPFSLTVHGTMAQIVDYLHRLESGAHYCRVLSASCTANAAERNGSLTLTLSIELLGQP